MKQYDEVKVKEYDYDDIQGRYFVRQELKNRVVMTVDELRDIWMTAWTGCKYRGMGLDPNEELSDYLKKHGIKESSITP